MPGVFTPGAERPEPKFAFSHPLLPRSVWE